MAGQVAMMVPVLVLALVQPRVRALAPVLVPLVALVQLVLAPEQAVVLPPVQLAEQVLVEPPALLADWASAP